MMGRMTQAQIASDLFDECVRLKGVVRDKSDENERLRAALREIQALTGRTDIKWPDKKAAIRRLVTEALGDD